MPRIAPYLLSASTLLVLAAAALAAFGEASPANAATSVNDSIDIPATIAVLCGLSLALTAGYALVVRKAARARETALAAHLMPVLGRKAKDDTVYNFEHSHQLIDDIIVEYTNSKGAVAQLNAELEQTRKDLAHAKNEILLARERGEAARSHSLHSASKTLGEAIAGIHGAAGALQDAADSAGRAASEQTRFTGETATAMTQMNASVAEVAEGAERATAAADKAMERAREGQEAVGETVEAILEVNRRTGELAGVVSGLGEQAEGIGRIMSVIADIADQTNLLALNAAIEAARAGDAGRGFAVVADEVRKLAEKTMEATRDVGLQVESIQTGVRRTGQGMTDASEMVEQATGLARRSGEMLLSIVDLAGENADRIREIAAAATEQSAASEQITHSVSQVDELSRRTMEDMDESGHAVDKLLAGLAELDGLNGAFDLLGSGKVQSVIADLAASSDILSMIPERQEDALRRAVKENAMLELAYLTDAHGIQPIANIARPGSQSPDDEKARGRDWSSRPWFSDPMRSLTICISNVYVSSATGQRCITVSAPLFAQGGDEVLGVIAADVTLE